MSLVGNWSGRGVGSGNSEHRSPEVGVWLAGQGAMRADGTGGRGGNKQSLGPVVWGLEGRGMALGFMLRAMEGFEQKSNMI